MPPKREAGATPAQPPIKMIKIGGDAQEFGCDPTEDKYRLAEESSFSPFPNNEVREFFWNVHKERNKQRNKHSCCLLHPMWKLFKWFLFFFSQHEHIEFDEEQVSSPGIRTDTISLLMKIEQLQAQLKYERRCRILAERELRELKGGWNKMTNTLNFHTKNISKKHLSWPHSLIISLMYVTHCNHKQDSAVRTTEVSPLSHSCKFGLQSTVKSTVILHMLGFLRLIQDLRSILLICCAQHDTELK